MAAVWSGVSPLLFRLEIFFNNLSRAGVLQSFNIGDESSEIFWSPEMFDGVEGPLGLGPLTTCSGARGGESMQASATKKLIWWKKINLTKKRIWRKNEFDETKLSWWKKNFDEKICISFCSFTKEFDETKISKWDGKIHRFCCRACTLKNSWNRWMSL